MKHRCSLCEFCKGYYRCKTDSTGLGRLVNYYCEHSNAPKESDSLYGFIAMSRVGVYEKVITSPRWCPLRSKNKKGLTEQHTAEEV